MRCHICNSVLNPNEVQFNRDHEEWDPCGRCLDAIEDVFSNDLEEEIDEQLSIELGEATTLWEWAEILAKKEEEGNP